MAFHFRKGLNICTDAGPRGGIGVPRHVRTIAMVGDDYPGVTFDLRVADGDAVAAGQVLCVDRHRPRVCFVAPVAGRVSRIKLGARRRLELLEIELDGDAALAFDVDHAIQDATALRDVLLESGAWTSFRTRPFGLVPDPECTAAAIFVTVTDTNPLAPDPVSVVAPCLPQFKRGIDALLRLTTGTVFVCQPPGAPLITVQDRVKVAYFSGPHPAGLAGTHIHHLLPASRQRPVWQIGYQDVIAIGHLLETGQIMATRMVSLVGAGLAGPTLVNVPLGANLADLVKGQEHAQSLDNLALLSGSVLLGREAAFLRRHDVQVTAVERNLRANGRRPFWHRFLDALPRADSSAVVPIEAFERAFPFDLLPVPLMRALAVGDIDTADRLGCLELLEDDLALLSWICPSGSDYGALLRHVLNTLSQEVST